MNSELTSEYLTRIIDSIMETFSEALLNKKSGWIKEEIPKIITLISSNIILNLTMPAIEAIEAACSKHDKKILLEEILAAINQSVLNGFEIVKDDCYSKTKH